MRLTAILLCLCTLFSLLALSVTATGQTQTSETVKLPPESGEEVAPPSQPEAELPVLTRCDAGGVCNAQTGEMLFSMNENQTVYPAASAKLMTALVVLECYEGKLDEEIRITEGMLSGVSGVSVNLVAGEVLTVRHLLACLVIGSANDAALVLARAAYGSVDAFVEQMNEKADELGMVHTSYRNPTGLHHDKMVTTVKDTLLLAMEMRAQDEFMNLCGRESYEIEATPYTARRVVNNRNHMVSARLVSDYHDPTCDGMSYGSTYEAGGVLVASTMQDGTAYIAVIFGGDTDTITVSEEQTVTNADGSVTVVPAVTKTITHAFPEAKKLLDWAKASFTYYRVTATSDAVCEIPVRLGAGKSHVTLFAAQNLELYLPATADIDAKLRKETLLWDKSLTAPVSAGRVCGEMVIYYEDVEVGRVQLVTRSTVDKSVLDYYTDQARAFASSQVFRTAMIALVCALVLYVTCMSIWRYQTRIRSMRRQGRTQEDTQRSGKR